MRANLLALLPTLLLCAAVMVVGVALHPEHAGQLESATSLATFAINLLTMLLATLILAAAAGAYYTLRRQVFAQRVVGRYRLVERIGQGGMSEVWRARHPGLGHDIAVKILRTDRATPTMVERFQAEVAALAELSHAHTVRILDSGVTDDGLCYYAMELLEGETLAARIARGTLPIADALELARQIAGALREAHGRGLVHRDLKPENVFVVGSGLAKLLDFGIAKRIGTAISLGGSGGGVVGTPAYMAPEQRAGATVDARADVYALGAVLFHMLVGRPPGDLGPDAARRELLAVATTPVADLVAGCLATLPEQRIASMAELERRIAALGFTRAAPIAAAPPPRGDASTVPLRVVTAPTRPLGRQGAASAMAAPSGELGGAAELEHRGNVVRARAVLGWGALSWSSTASIDFLVEVTRGGVDFPFMLGVRAGVLALLVAVWLRLKLGPLPTPRQLSALLWIAFAGGAAVGLGLLTWRWDGLDGLMFGGMSCVLIAHGLAVPGALGDVTRRMVGTLVAYMITVVIGAIAVPELRPQLASGRSWAIFGHYAFIMAVYLVLLAAAGDAYWQLRRQLFAQRLVGRYRLRRLLGRGGMGEVWLAQQPGLAREVAVKILDSAELSAIAVKRFEAEVAALRALRNPHVVHVHDAGITDDGLRYYVMEYVAGETLTHRVRAGGPLTPRHAVAIARQVARALAEAHARGLVHRDLKPDNVLLVPGVEPGADHVKVIDFGIARRTDDTERLTQTGTVLGTPAFMAPEQATGGRSDARSDVYALGAVLFFALTGRPPFLGDSLVELMHAQVQAPAPRPSTFAPRLPAALDALVLTCLAKNPAERPPSMSELDRRLADLAPVLDLVPAADADVPFHPHAETLDA
jgi:serine/threonine-protein kinase